MTASYRNNNRSTISASLSTLYPSNQAAVPGEAALPLAGRRRYCWIVLACEPSGSCKNCQVAKACFIWFPQGMVLLLKTTARDHCSEFQMFQWNRQMPNTAPTHWINCKIALKQNMKGNTERFSSGILYLMWTPNSPFRTDVRFAILEFGWCRCGSKRLDCQMRNI